MNHFTKVPRRISEETKEFLVFLGLIKGLLCSLFLKICKNEEAIPFFFLYNFLF